MAVGAFDELFIDFETRNLSGVLREIQEVANRTKDAQRGIDALRNSSNQSGQQQSYSAPQSSGLGSIISAAIPIAVAAQLSRQGPSASPSISAITGLNSSVQSLEKAINSRPPLPVGHVYENVTRVRDTKSGRFAPIPTGVDTLKMPETPAPPAPPDVKPPSVPKAKKPRAKKPKTPPKPRAKKPKTPPKTRVSRAKKPKLPPDVTNSGFRDFGSGNWNFRGVSGPNVPPGAMVPYVPPKAMVPFKQSEPGEMSRFIIPVHLVKVAPGILAAIKGGIGTGDGRGGGLGLRNAPAVATGILAGLVTSGLQGTVEGAKLSDQFQLLSREIAGAFLPVIRQFTAHIQKLNFWLQNLNREDQRKIMMGGLGVAGVGAGIAAAPILAPLLAALVKPLAGIAAVSGPVGWALAALAAGLAYVAVMSENLGGSFSKLYERAANLWKSLEPLREVMFKIAEAGLIGFMEMLSETIELVSPVIINLANAIAFMTKKLMEAWEEVGFWIGRRIAKNIDGNNVIGDIDAPGRKIIGRNKAGADRERVSLLGQGTESEEQSYRRLQDAANRMFGNEDPQIIELRGINAGVQKLVEQGMNRNNGQQAAFVPAGDKAG